MDSGLYDDGESFAVDDLTPDEVDWDKVAELEARHRAALALPEGAERSLAMLALLDEMYGDTLDVR